MVTGQNLERTFKSGEKFEIPDIMFKDMNFLYKDENGFNFMDPSDYDQVTLSPEVVAEGLKVLDAVTGDYPALSRRLRDETGSIRRYVNIYVNGNEIRRLQGLVTAVAPGQEVLIIQSVAGG